LPIHLPPPNEWGHTWGASLTMNVGDTLDVIATFPAELTDGWLEATGTMKVNGYVTTFAAFKDTSTMNLEAIGSVTLSLYGK